MPETEKESKAREAVNDRIANTKTSDMNRMIDAGKSSQREREDTRKEKEERERRENERKEKEAAASNSGSRS
ncbi:hypothetical protein LZ554_000489 [Drepanopeziza brunnea f. sp. 'monogermtubi']|nr:hypothetical protein LZ554_000489 [Drepanopeziza brunnea f. sp. 'monogermtubi']